ncbi:MAG: hypothetical protein QM765_47175 [Myxococcales bacterium]
MLWKRLYNTVWLASFSFLAIPHIFGRHLAVAIIHAAFGIAMLVMARMNANEVSKMAVPDRIKRISKGVVMTTTLLAVLGVVLGALKHISGVPELAANIVAGFHVFIALAVLSQSSSLATAFDMWEEKEIAPSQPTPPAAS